jgi:hypothetical protein
LKFALAGIIKRNTAMQNTEIGGGGSFYLKYQ